MRLHYNKFLYSSNGIWLKSSQVSVRLFLVKLQSKLNSSVQVKQGVDFVFTLAQQEQEEQEPSPKSTRTKCTTDLEFGT